MSHSFLFLCMFHIFLLKTGYFEYYDGQRKKRKKYSLCLCRLTQCLDMPSTLRQFTVLSQPSFAACTEPKDQPEVKSCGLTRFFLGMYSALTILMDLQISLYVQQLFKASIPPKCLTPWTFLSGFQHVFCLTPLLLFIPGVSSLYACLSLISVTAQLHYPDKSLKSVKTKESPLQQTSKETPSVAKQSDKIPWVQGPHNSSRTKY